MAVEDPLDDVGGEQGQAEDAADIGGVDLLRRGDLRDGGGDAALDRSRRMNARGGTLATVALGESSLIRNPTRDCAEMMIVATPGRVDRCA